MSSNSFRSVRVAWWVILFLVWPFGAAAQLFPGKSSVRVGVALPLKERTQRGSKMVEFYQGMLLAVDSMRNEGLDVELTALHSGSSAADMEDLLSSDPLSGCDVVFGPLDAAQLPALAAYCHERDIRLVVPFSTLATQVSGHPRYFMASAPRTVVQREAAWYVRNQFADCCLIAVDTEDPNDEGRSFVETVRSAMAEVAVPVRLLSSVADAAAYEQAIVPQQKNVFILNSSSQKALNAFLPRLREFTFQHPDVEVSLFGYPSWQTYTAQSLQDFYLLDTYVYTSFYRNPFSPRVKDFDSRFVRWFQRPMQATFPRYGQLGFDLGYFFLRGLSIYGDRLEDAIQSVPTNPYQHSFWFERQGEADGFVNTNVELIHYTPYETIDLLTRTR